MFYQLPPAGNKIHLTPCSEGVDGVTQLFGPWRTAWYDSGTSALAVAVSAAVSLKKTDHPEVLLPAYGCPDLVSAVLYAGAKPVLIDLEPERPWMDLDILATRINDNTAAIIAVDLFGISERFDELRKISRQAGVVLIEDSAQSFPLEGGDDFWSGDLVVLSFGRGKPVSLLGGGAVLYRDGEAGKQFAENCTDCDGGNQGVALGFSLKALIYNAMIDPRLYWILQAIPIMYLGETRFHPLSAVTAMDPGRKMLLATNVEAYRGTGLEQQNEIHRQLRQMQDMQDLILDLPDACGIGSSRKLLRYPLLVNACIRDKLFASLRHQGLGSSIMYPSCLPQIVGLEELLRGQGPFPAATEFARCILTLPTHQGVGKRDLAKMSAIIHQVASDAI